MPQSERSKNLKEIVKWLASLEREKATVPAIFKHVKWEITEGGATNSTIRKYIEDLAQGGIIEYQHPFWKVTKFGRTWIDRHSL